MKIKYMNLVLALALTVAGLLGQGLTANAKDDAKASWNVIYTGSKLDDSSYSVDKATIQNVMPGDTFTYEVTYKNDSGKSADFYLSTDVIDSLEDEGDATGGAYTYKLYYEANGKKTDLYSNDLVGGESSIVGLHQVQGNLEADEKTYFGIGTLAGGSSGKVTLVISLDGNSQDSDYMQKLAQIDFKFGVEDTPNPKPETKVITNTKTRRVVYTIPGGTEVVAINDPSIPLAGGGPVTGDSILPLIICTVTLLIGILLIGLYFIAAKKQREEVA